MGRKPSSAKDKFIVRLPDGMRDQLKIAAEANNRSMTAEMVERLKASFEDVEVPNFTSSIFLETAKQELGIISSQIRALEIANQMLTTELRTHIAKNSAK